VLEQKYLYIRWRRLSKQNCRKFRIMFGSPRRFLGVQGHYWNFGFFGQ